MDDFRIKVDHAVMAPARHLYRGRIIDLRLEDVTLPNGARVNLEIVHHPGAAAVVAVDDQRQVVLIHQYRHAASGYVWELPAGIPNEGEAPLDCARRELIEETGLDASDWFALGTIFTSPGFCDERIHLFLARGLAEAEQNLDHDEVLTVTRVPLARALHMIREGQIQDAKSIAGLHHAAAVLNDS